MAHKTTEQISLLKIVDALKMAWKVSDCLSDEQREDMNDENEPLDCDSNVIYVDHLVHL